MNSIKRTYLRLSISILLFMIAGLLFSGCGTRQKEPAGTTASASQPSAASAGTAGSETTTVQTAAAEKQDVTVLLDWVPNTNHTGLYVAVDNGYYAEEGLNVKIVQPPEGGTLDLVAAGKGDFGVSYQEEVTTARTADNPLPVKAIAAVIQHNTSGFASPAAKNIKRPKDFEGKKYGGWGAPSEEATLKGIMQKDGGDFSKLKMVNIGEADFFTAVQKDVDFSWIYYGWDGVAAGIKNFPINFIRLSDVDPNLDYYTPVLAASEDTLKNKPEVVKKFLRATAKGYKFAIEKPEEAAAILVKNAPETDKAIAAASQKYLAGEYMKGTEVWGEMKLSMWENYAKWMYGNKLLPKPLNAQEAFTNDFLEK